MSHPDTGVELLERALGYTRGALLHVRPQHLHHPTPCAGWDLDQLLDHMDDALDAFTEGADGSIDVDPAHRPLDVRVAGLQTKACALLGAWAAPGTPSLVVVGGVPVPTPIIVRAAALEITVHGWDVAQATGHGTPVPDALAAELLLVAGMLVEDGDRGRRFSAPVPTARGADPGERLVAWLGRRDLTGPVHQVSLNRRTPQRPAS